MEDELNQLAEQIAIVANHQSRLIADSAALFAVVRALAEANSSNPVFKTTLKILVDARAAAQLNSTQTDQNIELFNKSLDALLPKGLREQ